METQTTTPEIVESDVLKAARLVNQGDVSAFWSVVKTAADLCEFVHYFVSGQLGRKSLGSRAKRLVRQWLASRSDFEIFVHGRDLRTVIKLAHPRPETESRRALYGYFVGRRFDVEALDPEVRSIIERTVK